MSDVFVEGIEEANIEELPGGEFKVSYSEIENLEDEPSYVDHDTNFAELLDPDELRIIGTEVVQFAEDDEDTREPWRQKFAKGLENFGAAEEQGVELLFDGAANLLHPMLGEAVYQFQARAAAELLPESGPVKVKVVGETNDELKDRQRRVEQFLNWYLMDSEDVGDEYSTDFDELLAYLPLSGSAFKKIYIDPILGTPVSKFITAEKFLVPYDTKSLREAIRYTHVIDMSPNDLKQMQASGFYKADEIGDAVSIEVKAEGDRLSEAIDDLHGQEKNTGHSEPDMYRLYEMHVDWDLPEPYHDPDGIARPHIITVDSESGKVLAIRRNWREGDPLKRKRVWFVHYKFLPSGLGFYGFGLIHMLGALSRTATAVLRNLLDAGAFANLPAILKLRGTRIPGGTEEWGPGEWVDVDGSFEDIKKTVMPIPYREPSRTLYDLLEFVVNAGQRFASTTEQMVGDAANTGPVGTTVALIEQGSKVYTGIHKRLHRSQKREFIIIAELMSEVVPEEWEYALGRQVFQEDFDNRVDIVPVSDPRIISQTQRIALAQESLALAQSAPELHDMREAYVRMYNAMGVQQVDDLLKKPDEGTMLDPVSENMLMLNGMKVRAFAFQDHAAHLQVLESWFASLDPQTQEQVYPLVMAHRAEHLAYMYHQQMMQLTGTRLPMPDIYYGEDHMTMDPRIEARLSEAMARASEQIQPAQSPEEAQAEAELELKRQETEAKIARDDAKAQADIESKRALTQADLQRKGAQFREAATLRADDHMTDKQIQDAKTRQDLALDRKKTDAAIQADRIKTAADVSNQTKKTNSDIELAREAANQELRLEEQKVNADIEVKKKLANAQAKAAKEKPNEE